MSMRPRKIVSLMAFVVSSAAADEILYTYEGDVLPCDDSSRWVHGSHCEDPCSESLQDGHFVFTWTVAGDVVYYDYLIADPTEEPPPTLWVEWRFRSNHPIGPYFHSCDAAFTVDYGGMHDLVNMYGDAAISKSGDDFVTGLDLESFHTYRFESLNGVDYWIAVDGLVFMEDADDAPNGYHYIQFGGMGGCSSDQIPNMVNEWDFIRFGTIASGEQIIASDPPGGYLNPAEHGNLDRFRVTFDAPNFVYLDEISVAVSGGVAPVVSRVWRREHDGPETVEIVLDRPLPMDEVTTFTFDDGEAVNVVEYAYGPWPICGDNVVNQPSEECDGTDDGDCPGECGPLCTCPGTTGPECGNGIVEIGEECDGTDDSTCPGRCLEDCTCEPPASGDPECGNGIVDPEIGEECDGADDAACPGLCRQDCTCPPGAEIPTVSSWGLLILTLLLLVSGKLFFNRRRAA